MNTVIRKTDVDNIDMKVINEAGDVIRHGGLVALPT